MTTPKPAVPTPAHVHGPGCHHDHDHAHPEGAMDPLDPTTLMGRQPHFRMEPKVGRNDPCPCGSGKKHKKCHGA